MLTLPAAATVFVQVPVTAVVDGSPYDPTHDGVTPDPVAMAFTQIGTDPVTGDWQPATWQGTPPGSLNAVCLVGPATSTPLTAGVTYAVWVQITDNPEIPVLLAGYIAIF